MKRIYSIVAKILIFALFSICYTAPISADVEKKVVLQAFWWDYWHGNYPNSYANYLTELAPRLKGLGINAVWVPPFVKNTGTNSVGYSPFDHYDLGDKYQKGSVTTRFGTKDDVLRMIAVMHANGIEVIEDVVLNHVVGAGGEDGGAGGSDPAAYDDKWKNFRYVCYSTPYVNGGESDYCSRAGRWPKNWQNFHANPDHLSNEGDWCAGWWGPDVCYYENAIGQSSNATGYNPVQEKNYMRNEARSWLMWLTKQTAVDGFRWDAVKHFPEWAQQDFLYNVKYCLPDWCKGGEKMFSVGEYIGSKSEIDGYCSNVTGSNGGTEFLMGAFDVPLRGDAKSVHDAGGYGNIGNLVNCQLDSRTADYSSQKVHRSVNYVNSHDTFRPVLDDSGNYKGWDGDNETGGHIDPFSNRLGMMYAVMMALDGNVCVYLEDLFNLSNGKRYTHNPTSETDLPVRDAVKNLIWCHQNLNFKYGDYKVRWQADDLLVIERSGRAVIAITDNGSSNQEVWIDTDFKDVSMKDYSGGISGSRTAYADGRFQVAVSAEKGYAVWAPEGTSSSYSPYRSHVTVQEWEMADDLGDSHCESLGQGGMLPASSTNQRLVGKIYAASGKQISVAMHPAEDGSDITLAMYDLDGNRLAAENGTKDVTLTYTPTVSGWVAIKVWNTTTSGKGQKCWVRASYEAPASVTNTMSDRADTRASIWTSNGGSSDWSDCRNWEQGRVPGSSSKVVIPSNAMIAPRIDETTSIRELVVENGSGTSENPDIVVDAPLKVTSSFTVLNGKVQFCGNAKVTLPSGSTGYTDCNATVEIDETGSEAGFSVVPSITSDKVTVTVAGTPHGVMLLTDMSGRVMQVITVGESEFVIDLAPYVSGVYLLRNGERVEKIIRK